MVTRLAGASMLQNAKMASVKKCSLYHLSKYLLLALVALTIVGSIYYLTSANQALQELLEQNDRAERFDSALGDHLNLTLTRLTKYANEMRRKHEVTLVILISMSAVVASIAIIGLFGILRDNLAVIICFSCLMQVVFVASFMVPARIKPWSIVTVACCSICGFIFAYFLRRNHYLASLQVPNVLYQAEHNLKS